MPITLYLIRTLRTVRTRRWVGFATVLAGVVVAILGNAACFYYFDGAAKEAGFGDALWYSAISITTIGYGDFYASSLGARLGTLFFIVLIGLASFTVFLSMLIDWSTNLALKGQLGMGDAIASDHVLIVNFPSESRIRRLIEELHADPDHRNQEIVIVADTIEKLPFMIEGVLFIHGSPLEPATYERARLDHARLAIVLATAYSDPSSDAVVAGAVSVIEHLREDVHTIAECVDRNKAGLFRSVRCNAIVPALTIADNLLVQEVHDPGVSNIINIITSNLQGTTLFSTVVTESGTGVRYRDLAKSLLDRNVNVLAVSRGEQNFTAFGDLAAQAGDRIVYIANNRYDWPAMQNAIS